MRIYEDDRIYVEPHESEVPWIKIFTREPRKELTDCPPEVQDALWRATLESERTMREYYRPDKINIASFGNMLPRVHIHVTARFAGDSFFPEPMWGTRQREGSLDLPPARPFYEKLKRALTAVAIRSFQGK